MDIGFTGTREGMTNHQIASLYFTLIMLKGEPLTFHHGDCVGADAEAHKVVQHQGISVIIHPPIDSSRRAFCEDGYLWQKKPYMERNRDIVCFTKMLIACPKLSEKDSHRRSGTWATIRYARKLGRRLVIIWPDGTLEEEFR